jgi:hypothetical protein
LIGKKTALLANKPISRAIALDAVCLVQLASQKKARRDAELAAGLISSA